MPINQDTDNSVVDIDTAPISSDNPVTVESTEGSGSTSSSVSSALHNIAMSIINNWGKK